jgi:hypothetical protein
MKLLNLFHLGPFEYLVREALKAILAPHYSQQAVKVESDQSQKEDIQEHTSYPTYCVIFKARLNQNFFKQDAIDVIGEVMKDMCPSAKVEYKNPGLAIVFEVMKSHCCLSVLPNYFKYKKYNLIELASPISTQPIQEGNEIKSN